VIAYLPSRQSRASPKACAVRFEHHSGGRAARQRNSRGRSYRAKPRDGHHANSAGRRPRCTRRTMRIRTRRQCLEPRAWAASGVACKPATGGPTRGCERQASKGEICGQIIRPPSRPDLRSSHPSGLPTGLPTGQVGITPAGRCRTIACFFRNPCPAARGVIVRHVMIKEDLCRGTATCCQPATGSSQSATQVAYESPRAVYPLPDSEVAPTSLRFALVARRNQSIQAQRGEPR
jgi:hypothetical protein